MKRGEGHIGVMYMTTKERCWKVAMYIYSGLPKEQVFTKLAEK